MLTNLHQESLLIKDIALKNLVIHLAIAIQQTRKNSGYPPVASAHKDHPF
ncbi:hypothetical protein BsIDN1_04110 [Bacillus safensis]|uniref:Uncharacterized protein n=1 Tax=Bacillus safensis TaxID=561879 RepID=A0A5S9M0Z0_BACIA|nr:hypothetical protein BsIDN1_04110 [Bacillus safensis]